MSSLIINRFKYKILIEKPALTLSAIDPLFFGRNADFLCQKLGTPEFAQIINALKADLPENYKETKAKAYFDFIEVQNEHAFKITANISEFSFLKRAFIKKALIEVFNNLDYLIEPFPTGVDISVFQKKSAYNNFWNIYTRFDIVIFPFENEISISIGSSDTLISSVFFDNGQNEHLKIIDTKDGFIKRVKFNTGETNSLIVANAAKRKELNIKNKPQRIFYNSQYKTINNIYQLLLNSNSEIIRFESGGFKTIHPADVGQVDFDKNKMLFGKGLTDVNAATGMRDGGPFEIPKEKAENIKFLFIYENREQANNLFTYLKKGLKHYPGLLSYVGISVNVTNERLQYTNEQSFVDEFNVFVQNVLTNENYDDYFALVLLPFSRESADTVENTLYFSIKEKLLKKGIPSQLIDSTKINSANFHYHLPNISIAILAKVGGIPWKLVRKPYSELIVGFNEETCDDDSMLGTVVYFDNSGKLKQVKSFHCNERSDLIIALKDSIQNYLEVNQNNEPERLIIHYYKPPRREEMEKIDDLIREHFRFNLPFAMVEINDTKVNTEICFDVEFNYGMPVSGTFVRLSKNGNEYLLFNNQRYWTNPIKAISVEEYPIKIKLYNTETGGFNHKELLSQVYEFSRLYWKGLKQRSQPVTTQYSKMIAEFAIHFENGEIPQNETSQNTAWFI